MTHMPNQVSRSRQIPDIRRDCSKRWPLVAAALLTIGTLLTTARAADNNVGMGLLNLTSSPITQVYASPAGQDTFGADQIALIPGGEIDHNKILSLTGLAPGRYLLRITDNSGRVCWARNVNLQVNEVAPLRDTDMTDCDP